MSGADPTFLIIGAPKCGTSWLWQMLLHHPQVAMPTEKELHFFDRSERYHRGLSWYRSQFPAGSSTRAVGEASPSYFAGGMDLESCIGHENLACANLIHRHFPELQLIVLLRDPVQRAVSNYHQRIKVGAISPRISFTRREYTQAMIEVGYYDVHLTRWIKLFGRDRMLILFYEEAIAKDRERTLQTVFRFLNVDPDWQPSNWNEIVNPTPSHLSIRVEHAGRALARKVECGSAGSWAPKIDRLARRVRHQVEKALPRKILRSRHWEIPFPESEMAFLRDEYAQHNRELAELLGRTLPWGS